MTSTIVIGPLDEGPGDDQDHEGTTALMVQHLEHQGYDVRLVAHHAQDSYAAAANLRAVCRVEGRGLWLESDHLFSGAHATACEDSICGDVQAAYAKASAEAGDAAVARQEAAAAERRASYLTPEAVANAVRSTLAVLDADEADIASYLAEIGCTGERGSARTCPVNHYLMRKLGERFPGSGLEVETWVRRVGVTYRRVKPDGTLVGEAVSVTLPDDITAFILAFDDGEHPELESADTP